MIKKLLAVSAFLFASSAFAAPNLTGRWAIHNNIAGNENDAECQLVATDNKITGSCKSQDKDLPVTGTVDGNKVTWQFQSDYNGSPLTLIYKATLDESNKIAGTVEVKECGMTGDFTAVTSSAPSQSGRAAAGQSGSASSQSGPAPAGPSGPGDAAAEQLLVVQSGPGGIFKNQSGVGQGNPAGTACVESESRQETR